MAQNGLVNAGLNYLFKTPLLGKIVQGVGKAALGKPGEVLGKFLAEKVINPRFVFSSEELGKSLQSSYAMSLQAITVGLAPSWWNKFDTRVSKEFSSTVEDNYFYPICRDSQLNEQQSAALRDEFASLFAALSKMQEQVLPMSTFAETNLAEIVGRSQSFAVSEMLLKQIQKHQPLTPNALAFLSYRDLLGNALLHFFQENMKTLPRVKTAMETLMDRSLFEQLDRADMKQDQLREVLRQSVHQLEQQLASQQALQAQSQQHSAQAQEEQRQEAERLQRQLAMHHEMVKNWSHTTIMEARRAWNHVAGQVKDLQAEMGEGFDLIFHQQEEMLLALDDLAAKWGKTHKVVARTHDTVVGLEEYVRANFDMLFQQLSALQVSSEETNLLQEFHKKIAGQQEQESDIDDEALLEFAEHLESLETDTPDFQQHALSAAVALATRVGDALSRKRANRILERLCGAGVSDKVKARAYFLQFQNAICLQLWREAKEALEQASRLNREQYQLHDSEKYPLEEIIGANANGCILLCKTATSRHVAVKALWEVREGDLSDVFAEAWRISEMNMPAIPRLKRWGYAHLNQRPFVVMDYLEGAMDGHAFVEAHGPLELGEGLQVGLELASCLHALHLKGSTHLDIKPSCILLSKVDGVLRMQILDAGFAGAVPSVKERVARVSTKDNDILVQQICDELPYSAPELRGEIPGGQPGPKSDIFGFGATMYWLLTHRPPKKLNGGLLEESPALFRLLVQCVEDSPYDRPNTALEIVERLLELLEEYKHGPEGRFRYYLDQELPEAGTLTPFLRNQALAKGKEYGLEEASVLRLLGEFEQREEEGKQKPQAQADTETQKEPRAKPYAPKEASPLIAAEASTTYLTMRSLEQQKEPELPGLSIPVSLPVERSEAVLDNDAISEAPQGFVHVTPGTFEMGSGNHQLTAAQEAMLIDVTNKIVDKIKQDASTEDFWNDPIDQRKLRSWVEDMLDHPEVIDDLDQAEIATDRVMALAKKIRHRFMV